MHRLQKIMYHTEKFCLQSFCCTLLMLALKQDKWKQDIALRVMIFMNQLQRYQNYDI